MKTKLAVALTIICMKASAQWVEWPVSAGGNGHFYLPVMTTTNISWHDAQRLASEAGGYLVTVTSAAEDAFIFGLVSSFPEMQLGKGPWLGAFQPPGSQEPDGGWTWVTGEAWVYANWFATNPDNGGDEDAVHYVFGGKWNDKQSTGQFNSSFVAERNDGGFLTHTYFLITNTLTWHQAKEDAERRGGHLATITSQAEHDYIQSLGLHFHPEDAYWLGATDEGHEGTWTWVTGEPFVFNRWNLNLGEPNNLGGENYLLGEQDAGHLWNDWGQSGNVQPYYLLEIENTICTPRKAKATAQLVNGFVVGATITDGGCGYTNPPVVLIQGGGGSGAMATAVISNGLVVAIEILNAGFSYETPPRVVIGSPPFVPTVNIAVSKVNVTQNVVLGWKYVLESSTNAFDWAATAEPFVADSESIVKEFDADTPARMFRLRVVP